MKKRARDLGLKFNGETGPYNAITDVAGIEVGFSTIIENSGNVGDGSGPIRTGVTAILPRGRQSTARPVWAGQHNLNGNGEMTGTHWINEAGYFLSPICITNTHSVGMVHHGVVKWMVEQHQAQFKAQHNFAMPVVAETYDGVLNDICGQHVGVEHVFDALDNAKTGAVAEGNVGGGTGMISYEFKAGTGTASRLVKVKDECFTIGVLVQANFGLRDDFMCLGVPVGKHLVEHKIMQEIREQEMGSIIVIIATDLPLSPTQLKRVAKRASLGMARTGTFGGHGSGDIFLAFSTANAGSDADEGITNFKLLDDVPYMDNVYKAGVEAVEEAIINSIVAGEAMDSVKPTGHLVSAIDHEELCNIMAEYGRM